MKIEELRVRLWHKRYKRTKDDKIFQKIWLQVKNMVPEPYGQFPECASGHWDSVRMLAVLEGLSSYDPKHTVVTQQAIEVPHREEIRRVLTVPKMISLPNGEFKCIKIKREVVIPGALRFKLKIITTERVSEMTLLSFLRFRMEQAIRVEKRDLLLQRRNVALDNTYADDDHTQADEILFKRLAQPEKLNVKDPEKEDAAYNVLIKAVEKRLQEKGEARILRAFRLKLQNPAITNRSIAKTLKVSKSYTSGYFRVLQMIIEEVIEETDLVI